MENFLLNNPIYSLESEKTLHELAKSKAFAFINELKKADSTYSGKNVKSKSLIQALNEAQGVGQHFFLNSVCPEVIVITEQYAYFEFLKLNYSQKNNCKIDTLIKQKIQEGNSYFQQFDGLYRKFTNTWKIVTDFERLNAQIMLYRQVKKNIDKQQNIPTVLILDIIKYQEKILQDEISLDEIQDNLLYQGVRYYLVYFCENEEVIKEKAVNYITSGSYNKDAKMRLEWIISINRYKAEDINYIYQKNYSHIRQRADIQTFFRSLEELINEHE